MLTEAPHFDDLHAASPDADAAARSYRGVHAALDRARTRDDRLAAVRAWDDLRREFSTWQNLTELNFNRDTENADYRRERERLDALEPRLAELKVALLRRVLDDPELRADIAETFGSNALALWRDDVESFDPRIAADVEAESGLVARFIERMAAVRVPFDGADHTLESIRGYFERGDRDMRHGAHAARWEAMRHAAADLDGSFDDLVHVRHRMACTLGYDDYLAMGYRRMHRVDYGRDDVERYRDEVAREIVPLASRIVAQRARRLGLERAMLWDEAIGDPGGNPAPRGGLEWTVARATEVFGDIHPDIASCFTMMRERGLLDLAARTGKAGGGFCTSFPTLGVPFIFANFNGTGDDVRVLVHEMGHAFADRRSNGQPLLDYLVPTYESAEVHSMGMESLSLPFAQRFFGDDARRFAADHLGRTMLFMPYGVAIDHFQHLVYAQPDATPGQRHAMWREMEARYLPWRHYGDLAYPSGGAFWQQQRHVYIVPLYYIDYTLAQCCALQIWARAQTERGTMIDDYLALCGRGGSVPFRELISSAGLRSPFEAGCLRDVAQRVAAFLDV